mgnify:CR=1 FL=1
MTEASSVELRGDPRFNVDISGQAQVREAVYAVRLTNLSQSGLQLECDKRLNEQLSVLPQPSGSTASCTLEVSFNVSIGGSRQQPVNVQCEAVYRRPLAQERYILGCGLAGVELSVESPLEAFLDRFPRQQSLF